MTPYHADHWLTIYGGDCREVMRELPAESVHCVITSPPYWGLRDYGTASWDGGDADCDHVAPRGGGPISSSTLGPAGQQGGEWHERTFAATARQFGTVCGKCGARRIDAQLGLEATPEEYVATMVDVFREVRRVLRPDGTVWLNLGDSYAGGTQTGRNDADTIRAVDAASGRRPNAMAYGDNDRGGRTKTERRDGLKPKDLVGIPWRVAFALQADGWYLRSDIVWSKPNPMPESVADRPTKAHEYVFLLSKSARYFYDADAVREDYSDKTWFYDHALDAASDRNGATPGGGRGTGKATLGTAEARRHGGRNLRSVWTIATAPYPGAHFATFPPKLVEPCVKAGTSERGVCPDCGAPWTRVVEHQRRTETEVFTPKGAVRTATGMNSPKSGLAYPGWRKAEVADNINTTTGWRPMCDHDGYPVPAVVLDPFAGTGTVGLVAQSLSRRALLIDLNPEYLAQCLGRNRQMPLGVGS